MKFLFILGALLALAYPVVEAQDTCIIAADTEGAYKKVCGSFTVSDFTDSDEVQEPARWGSMDNAWVVICGALVFFMQAGFGMLEAGCVSEKNVLNILFKNIMDASLAAISYWLIGYGFAYGNADDGPFIGSANFGLSGETGEGFHSFFFQWAFTATAATIVAGSVAERCTPEAYFVYSIILSAFIYPVVVHWVWDTEGWMSAFNPNYYLLGTSHSGVGGTNNVIDFAGCGVVHMVGGFAGLVAAWVTGPRVGRFTDQDRHTPHNIVLCALGTLILWFGWYGFNCGSTLGLGGSNADTIGLVATNTTISAAAAATVCAFASKLMEGNYNVMSTCNGALAGLVSITSCCAYCQPWGAFIIGIVGACVYLLACKLMIALKIDDPLDAAPVHGFCGMWGLLCPGIFNSDAQVEKVLGWSNDCYSSGLQFGIQLVALITIVAWVTSTTFVLFMGIKYTIGLRVDEETELAGLDTSEHGGKAYESATEAEMTNLAAVEPKAEAAKVATETV